MSLSVIGDSLKLVFTLASDMKESTTLCQNVSERLAFIHKKLLAMEAKGTLPKEDLVMRYCGLVDNYKAFLEKQKNQVWVYRVVTSKHVLQKVGGFQDDIVTLLQALHLCHIEAMADERVKMQQFREEQERLILTRLTDDATIVAEVSREEQQVEALNVLVHELKAASAVVGDNAGSGTGAQVEDAKGGASGATTSTNSISISTKSTSANDRDFTDQKVLATALNKVMRQSRVRVDAVPDWFLAPHNVQYEPRPFAGGSFGLVHYGRMNFMDVVVKCLRVDMRTNAVMTGRFRDEASLWFGFRHRHVLMMYGACDVSSPPFIVCEYAARGNLADYLSVERNRDATVRLLGEAASGLAYLHSHRVVHADLKCDNILVASDGSAKIADFSFSYVRTLSASKRSVLVGGGSDGGVTTAKRAGAMRWRAPECLSGRSPTFASDVFSLGMSVIEAVTHDVPWGHFLDDVTVWQLVTSGKLPEKPARMSDRMWRLVERMCHFRAEERPSLESIVSALGAMSAADVGVVAIANVDVVVGAEVDAEARDATVSEISTRESGATTTSIAAVSGDIASVQSSQVQVQGAKTSTAHGASSETGASTLAAKSTPARSNKASTKRQSATTPPLASSDFRACLVDACRSNDVEAARAILQRRPNVLRHSQRANKKSLPLVIASKHGHAEITKLLLEYGADANASDDTGWTSLHHAALNGCVAVLVTLLASNANVNALNTELATPLYVAVMNGHTALALELIKKGANVSAVTKDGSATLHVAAEKGHVDTVRWLINHNASVNVVDKKGYTPVYRAAGSGHAPVVSELIKNGAKVSVGSKYLQTPLHTAAKNGHLDVVVELIKHKAKVNARDKDDATPLYLAANSGRDAVVSELIKHGANVNATSAKFLWTPLYVAAQSGHLDTVIVLLKHNADVNARGANSWTPLYIAASKGHSGILSELIKWGAEIDAATERVQKTPLWIAAENGRIGSVLELIKHTANLTATDQYGYTPMHIATQRGHTAVVSELIKCGVDVNAAVEKTFWTPLHVAARFANATMVVELVKHKADVNAINNQGCTPLHLAAENGRTAVVSELIKSGANVNAALDAKLGTPLHAAAANGHVDAVVELVKHKANANAISKEKCTPLYLAAEKGHSGVVFELIKCGVNVNAKSKAKLWTPLHTAASNGHIGTVLALIKHKAYVDVRENEGRTPLYLAAQRGHAGVVSELIKTGGDVNAVAKDGTTPLLIAVENGKKAVVEELIKHGADTTVTNRKGLTPLDVAVKEGQKAIAELVKPKRWWQRLGS